MQERNEAISVEPTHSRAPGAPGLVGVLTYVWQCEPYEIGQRLFRLVHLARLAPDCRRPYGHRT